ncbi:MAG: hypothetical protein IR527_01830 [Bacteroides sp.]|nr:MAG: hypothetical protein IR527_01830 [Bacteroides sp.]
MIYSITGKISLIKREIVIIFSNDVEYIIYISLYTYNKLLKHNYLDQKITIFTYLYISNNSNIILYGFFDLEEKFMFNLLLSVTKIGPNMCVNILSSIKSIESLKQDIINNNIQNIKDIKGIGNKSAKRIVLELQDKIYNMKNNIKHVDNKKYLQIEEESLKALIKLNINADVAKKIIKKVIKNNINISTSEEIIKKSLQLL